jgi:hypothetical protein
MCAMSPRLLRPVASGFNPKSISGLAMWLDANDSASITLDSSAVSEWKDKAAGKVFAQTTPNNRPTLTTINGKTALLFDGTNDTLSCSEPFASYPVSMFFVQRVIAYTNFGMTYTAGGSNNFNLRQNGTSGLFQLQHPTTGAGSSSTSYSLSNAELISLVYASPVGGSAAYQNGGLITITSGSFSEEPIFSGTTHFIGSRNAGFHLNGYIGEILVYTKTVSATERAKITQYLGKKWGITVV